MTRHLLAVATAAVLIPAGAAEAKSLHGTVVHRNHRAHSFVVASPSGQLASVHATKSPRLGRKVALRAARLGNGTFSANKVRGRGRAHRAHLAGVVTFVDKSKRTFTLSDNGASVLVHAGQTPAPAVGDTVDVNANLDDSSSDTVEADDVNVTGTATSPVEIEGVILAIDTTTRTLSVSADDNDVSGQSVSVVLPASFDITQFKVGDEIEIAATLNPDGATFTALATSGDENTDQADGNDDNQGDEQEFGDDHGGQTNAGGDDSSDDDTPPSTTTPGSTPTPGPDSSSGPGSSSGSGSGDGSGHHGGGD